MAGPCLTSAKGAVRVWATARSEEFTQGGVVQAAASAVDGTGPPIVSACNALHCNAVPSRLQHVCSRARIQQPAQGQ
jgi:hypothetical protein